MQSKWNRIQSGTARGTWVALLSVLVILLFAASASVAQGPPSTPIVVSQVTWYTPFPAGGVLAGATDGGSSWGINSKGVIVASTTYGGSVVYFNGPGYAATSAGSVGNVGGIAIDKNDNLYVGDQYSSVIAKIPANADGTYTITSDPTKTPAPPACTGATTDTAECLISEPGTALGYFGITSMAFDKAGDLFFATDSQGAAFSIYECNSTCLYGPTFTAPALIYTEPAGTTIGAATGQLYVGTMAFDPWGNLFYTDAVVVASGNGEDAASYVEELVYTASSKTFAAAPTTLATYLNPVPLTHYNDSIDTLYIDPTLGTVYFALQNEGIFALPNTKTGGPNSAGIYGVTGQGAKLLKADNYGNFFFVAYSNANSSDTLGYISFTGPTLAGSPSATTASLIIADNTEACTPTLNVLFSDSEYSSALGACSGMAVGTGSFIADAVTFTPNTGVTVAPPAAMTVTDTVSNASTSVAATGSTVSVVQSTFLTPFTGGGAFGGNAAGGTTGAINSMGVAVFGGSYGNEIYQFTQGGTVLTNLGNSKYGGANGMAIDSQNYLFMTTEYSNLMLKAPMNAADGTYPALPATAAKLAALPTCAGDGVAPDNAGICQFTPGGTTTGFGVAGLTFDSNGNMFISTDNEVPSTTITAPTSILECPATCMYGTTAGTASTDTQPIVLFSEPPADAAGDQLFVGGIAVDLSDNIFFTDDMLDGGGSGYNHYSDVYELKPDSTTATGYAAAPTLLETLTPPCAAAPCDYNNELDTVVADANGNIFFADQYTGIYEFANISGTVDVGNAIPVVAPGAKVIVPDGKGNFYFVAYSNNNSADTLGFDLVGSVAITGQATPTAPTSATISVLDNFSCATMPALTFTFSDPEFTVPATAPGCADMAIGGFSSFNQTVTFTPSATASGTVPTTLTVTDTTNGGAGTAAVTAQAASAQTITPSNPSASETVVYPVSPIVLSASASSGLAVTFSIDTNSTAGAATLAADGVTLTINTPGTVIIDENQAGGTSGATAYAAAPQVQITITVSQGTQTITFAPASPVTFGVAPITLTATGGDSGNAVTFTLDSTSTAGAATLSGSTLTITGAGTVVIDANQAASTDYAAAAQVQGSIVVNQAAQTITFAPTSPVVLGVAPITLTATGGASGNAVTFTLDSTSAAGAATLSGSTLTITGLGTVVIDANQAGNTNYAAAAQVKGSVVVNAPIAVATPTFTPATGATLYIGTTNTVAIADTTANAVIYYTTDGSTPTNKSAVYSGPITLSTVGSVTINALATLTGETSSSATATYTVSPVAPSIAAATSAPTLTITAPGSGTETITLTPTGGFNSAVTFTVSGLPADTTYSFNPATVTPGTTPNNSTVLTINASNPQSSFLRRNSNTFFPAATFAAVLCLFGIRKRRTLQLMLLLAISMVGMGVFTGCGRSSSKSKTLPPATGTVTVTATSTTPAVSTTTTFTLTVDYQ